LFLTSRFDPLEISRVEITPGFSRSQKVEYKFLNSKYERFDMEDIRKF
jgi:hypothetical protein